MLTLFDNTLRDGGNVVGDGFDTGLTQMIVGNLLSAGIKDIELGNCKGLGAYEIANAKNAPSDEEYFEAVRPYLGKGRIGMFLNAKRFDEKNIESAAENGLSFLRVGTVAGDGKDAVKAVKAVRKNGLTCRYSLMRGYVLTPEALLEEAKMLEQEGVQKISIMDSAGTMLPDEVERYVEKLKGSLSIPVGFHGHNNLGLSQGNAFAAYRAGADEIDCGLMGMARSAGNCCTESTVALFQRMGLLQDIDLEKLLVFIDEELQPRMLSFGYRAPLQPKELVLGLAGCHSSYMPVFEKLAEEYGVSVYKLICEVSAADRAHPSADLMRETAEKLKREKNV